MNWKKYFNVVSLALLSGGVFFILWSLLLPGDWREFGTAAIEAPTEEPQKPEHLPTPGSVRAIYMTSWVASTKDWRERLVDFIDTSEINSVIIDVKDYSGMIAFDTGDKFIKDIGSQEVRIKDLREFINYLHERDIYTIARITVFQDPVYAENFPDVAVHTKNGNLWKDRNGLMYIDPGAREFWYYITRVAKASENVGFDELNFDYIRFPSDGNMNDIAFPVSDRVIEQGIVASSSPYEIVLTGFFKYLRKELKDVGVPMSADVFGMTTTNTDDLNIGQVLESIDPYFDYIAPMVYPSHYPPDFQGLANPAAHPYEVVHFSMSEAVARLLAASSSPSKLRPWLQDFDLGAIYDAEKIRAQKQAVYDAGLTSWMMWDASNKYTREAYVDN